MEFRNARYNRFGGINAEVYSPALGWVDTTLEPGPLYGAALASGPAPYVPPAPSPVDPKLVGVLFQGVMCSATAADQSGLAAVLLAIQLQGSEFRPTRFYFENGNTLVITLQNYQAFTSVWLPFRQSFFTVE